jgi:hypothetical protein
MMSASRVGLTLLFFASPDRAAVLRNDLHWHPYGMYAALIRYAALIILHLAADSLPL